MKHSILVAGTAGGLAFVSRDGNMNEIHDNDGAKTERDEYKFKI